MKWGFKAEAARTASEVRTELGLEEREPFDAERLALQYGVTIYPLSRAAEWGCPPDLLQHFSSDMKATFSAALVPYLNGCFIIENDFHAATRRRATLTHEMSHVILEHDFPPTIAWGGGCNTLSHDVEVEADWLAGELLIPLEATRKLALRGLTDESIARIYEISTARAAMRMNQSGSRTIATRAHAARVKRSKSN
jgi:Zn-dependent peptidase ImmA (M78 family)